MATRVTPRPLVAEFRKLGDLVADVHPHGLVGTALSDLEAIRLQAARMIGMAVDQARENDYSWSQIGAALNISAQSAQQTHARRHRSINVD